LERISKNEMTYLIQKNILKQIHGNYGESLVVTGKYGSGRGKQRFCIDPVYNYLLRLKEKDRQELVDMDKVKDNQKYLFSGNSSVVSNSERVL